MGSFASVVKTFRCNLDVIQHSSLYEMIGYEKVGCLNLCILAKINLQSLKEVAGDERSV